MLKEGTNYELHEIHSLNTLPRESLEIDNRQIRVCVYLCTKSSSYKTRI